MPGRRAPAYYAQAMPRENYTAAQAARALGISLDTLRRWDRAGRIAVERDASNRRVVPSAEVERLRGERGGEALSARNRLAGIVAEVTVDGLLAQVEVDVAGPSRVVAIITRESAEELGLKPGASVSAVVKATSVMIQR